MTDPSEIRNLIQRAREKREFLEQVAAEHGPEQMMRMMEADPEVGLVSVFYHKPSGLTICFGGEPIDIPENTANPALFELKQLTTLFTGAQRLLQGMFQTLLLAPAEEQMELFRTIKVGERTEVPSTPALNAIADIINQSRLGEPSTTEGDASGE